MTKKQMLEAIAELTKLEANLAQNNDLIYAHTKNEFDTAKKDWEKLGSSIATNIDILDSMKNKYSQMLSDIVEDFNPVAVQNELLEIATSLKHAQEFLTLIGNSNLVDKAVSWGTVDNCLDGWASIWELDDKIDKTKELFDQIKQYALKKD